MSGIGACAPTMYLISNLIIYFHFPRACVRNYTMHELLYLYTAYCEFCTLLRGGGGPKSLSGKIPDFVVGYLVVGDFVVGDFVMGDFVMRDFVMGDYVIKWFRCKGFCHGGLCH